jgi:hypothetical protein
MSTHMHCALASSAVTQKHRLRCTGLILLVEVQLLFHACNCSPENQGHSYMHETTTVPRQVCFLFHEASIFVPIPIVPFLPCCCFRLGAFILQLRLRKSIVFLSLNGLGISLQLKEPSSNRVTH